LEIDEKEIDSPQTEPQSAFKLCFEFQRPWEVTCGQVVKAS